MSPGRVLSTQKEETLKCRHIAQWHPVSKLLRASPSGAKSLQAEQRRDSLIHLLLSMLP